MESKKEETALVSVKEKLAAMGREAAEQEAGIAGGGNFFSIRGGQLSFDGARIPGDKMAVVVVDSINENIYYPGRYDPDNTAPPTCFAFGRSDDDMAPDPSQVEEPQSSRCSTCPHNQWESADNGKGKACSNKRRLALIPAGTIDDDNQLEINEDPTHFETAEVAYLAVPTTSLRNYASYVKKASAILKRPPCALVTEISVRPDSKTTLVVEFDALAKLPDSLIPALLDRNETERDVIAFPYPKHAAAEEEEEPKGKTRKKKRATKF